MTDIPLKAQVNGTDGPIGTSTAVIIDPVSKSITHVVVQLSKHDDRVVSLKHIAATDHDSITLDCSKADLASMDQFNQTRFVEGVPVYPEFQGGEWEAPYVTMDYDQQAVDVEVVPVGELAVHRGDPVKATDGQVGIVGEFIIDSDSGHISHLVLEKGHLWGKREVSVPLDLIDKVDNSVVYLTITKKALKDLPEVKVKRHYSGKG